MVIPILFKYNVIVVSLCLLLFIYVCAQGVSFACWPARRPLKSTGSYVLDRIASPLPLRTYKLPVHHLCFSYIIVYICVYIYIYIHTYTYIHMHLLQYKHMCVYIYIYIHVYVCIYIYIYIHTYTHSCQNKHNKTNRQCIIYSFACRPCAHRGLGLGLGLDNITYYDVKYYTAIHNINILCNTYISLSIYTYHVYISLSIHISLSLYIYMHIYVHLI